MARVRVAFSRHVSHIRYTLHAPTERHMRHETRTVQSGLGTQVCRSLTEQTGIVIELTSRDLSHDR